MKPARKANPSMKHLKQRLSTAKGPRSCGKLQFSTYKKALRFSQSQTQKNPRADNLRPYECRRCGEWHTTSQA